MLEVLEQIINQYPGENNYLRKIKTKNKELYQWVCQQLPEIESINQKIYHLVNGSVATQCALGKDLVFKDYRRGYGYCGRAESCECLQSKCATTSLPYSEEKKVNVSAKTRKTKLDRYGDARYNNRAKSKATLKKNYGVEYTMHSDILRDRQRQTNITRYGAPNPMQNDQIKKRAIESNIRNNGAFHTCAHLSQEILEKINSIDFLISENKTKSPVMIAKELGVTHHAIYKKLWDSSIDYIRHTNFSVWEAEVANYIESLNIDIIRRDRKIIYPQEIDIVVPSHKLAIECNGLRWHSEISGNKDRKYHINKTVCAQESGYKLIHIYDYEWVNSPEIVQSRISNFLGLNRSVFARNCTVRLIDKIDEKNFLEINHIQGYCPSNYALGLYYGNELISVMSFGKPRFSKSYQYELLRFASVNFTTAVGGASKLFKWFIREINPKSVISYSDKRWGRASVYEKLGFRYLHTSNPSYYYTSNFHKLENRMKFQKHRLNSILSDFDPKLTEWENMKNHGYDRVWDCGNDVWLWEFDK